jgi:hypothetical protein
MRKKKVVGTTKTIGVNLNKVVLTTQILMMIRIRKTRK